ncbi:MAG: DUF6090 family protein [Lutimonas sp.]
MIKFFRKMRYEFMEKNPPPDLTSKSGKPALQVGRYLKYAIGEIVLVVLGILIALSINNWNNDLVDQRTEQNIVKNLNMEFKQNKSTIQESIAFHKSILTSARHVMKLIGQPKEVLDKNNLDSLISSSLDYTEYRPSQVVYADLIASGRLNLLPEDLRLLLFEWSINLDGKKEGYDTLDEIAQTLLLSYLTKNASMKNIDSYSIVKWKEKSKVIGDYYMMFQDLEFENNIENQVWNLTNYIITLENLEKATDKVIEKTNK